MLLVVDKSETNCHHLITIEGHKANRFVAMYLSKSDIKNLHATSCQQVDDKKLVATTYDGRPAIVCRVERICRKSVEVSGNLVAR